MYVAGLLHKLNLVKSKQSVLGLPECRPTDWGGGRGAVKATNVWSHGLEARSPEPGCQQALKQLREGSSLPLPGFLSWLGLLGAP